MAINSLLTPLVILRESLRVLHGKIPFISSINRAYDSQFAKTGAKIGTQLNIRLPSKYTVRTGATLVPQEHVERSTPLYVTSQIGIDLSFSSVELTMQLDDFSSRIIEPAMSQLGAYLESAALSAAYKLVPNYTGTTSTQMTFKQFQQAGQTLTENLAPPSGRTHLLNPASLVEFMDATKGLFAHQTNLNTQFKEGMMGRTGGFDVFEDTFLPTHTRGSLAGTPLTTGAALGNSVTTNAWVATSTIDIDGATSGTTIAAGDIVTFGAAGNGIYDVHPESKASTGRLKKFVVQAAVTVVTAGTTTITVSPGLIWGSGNSYQNATLVGAADTNNMTVSVFGVASTSYGQNLAYHKDAFTFCTADLISVEEFGAWSARDSMDGISMRIAKQYAISSDTVPCRVDVLWGFAGQYPELAARGFHALT